MPSAVLDISASQSWLASGQLTLWLQVFAGQQHPVHKLEAVIVGVAVCFVHKQRIARLLKGELLRGSKQGCQKGMEKMRARGWTQCYSAPF